MALLAQFLLRLSFGLAVGMAVTSPRLVTSGFFRNHLYVILGLTTLAALAATQISPQVAMLPVAAAVLSYIGSVCWLYEAKRAGVAMLWIVAACALAGALIGQVVAGEFSGAAYLITNVGRPIEPGTSFLNCLSVVSSGLLLGFVSASMFLGHWYLNSPGMELAPLRRLLVCAALAAGFQMFVSGLGVIGEAGSFPIESDSWYLFIALRWAFGLFGVLALVWMAWQTLRIPNTQSATGILYVAVIGVFVGELTALLLSAESAFPL